MIGTTITHYKVLSRLGVGGMGEVYEAEDLNLKRRVAIKVLPPAMSDSVERLQRFQREAEAVAALNHPNICTIHDIGEHEGQPFLVMELLKGDTLKERITGEPLDPNYVVDLGVQIVDALDSAHGEGIIHRDIKPANLFVTDRGYAKILDFGLAKLTESVAQSDSGMPTAAAVDRSLTSPGATVGTVAYMSPEQVRGQDLDSRTDLFSFGVVLYEMATGKQPFSGTTSGVIFSEILNGGYIAPVRLNPAMPDDLERIIAKLLEKDRDIRYQTARDLLADLKRLRRDTGSGHSAVSGAQPQVSPPAPTEPSEPGYPSASLPSQPPSGGSVSPSASTPQPPTAASTEGPTPSGAVPASPPSTATATVSGAVPTMDSTASGSVVMVHKDSGKAPWWVAGIAVVGLILLAGLWIFRSTSLQQDATVIPTAATEEAADSSETATTPSRKMIVVIPFENLGSTEDEYFATGMTEEITSRLASVSGLGVISRNSAAQYAGRDAPIQQIGDELGVDYVLEGTVRWAGDEESSRVRITPQLISVADDTQVWSNSYDRVVDDIFEVQTDIATQVIGQLGIALLGNEQEALQSRPTDNLEAYKYYLRGWEYWTHPDLTDRQFQVSSQMFQRAVELDPEFALAHAYLSMAHSRVYWFGGDTGRSRMVESRAAADRALQLDPNLGEAHMALGYVHYYGSRAYEQALEEFRKAEQLLPGNAEAIGAIGFIQRRQGKLDEAAASFKRALELDPRAADMADNVADALVRLRRHEEADLYFDRSISILPDQITAYFGKATNLWNWRGSADEVRAIMSRMPEHQSTSAVNSWYVAEVAIRDFESILARLEAAPFEFFDTSTIAVLPKSMRVGRVLHLMGRDNESRAAYQEALPHLERYVREHPDTGHSHAGLALVLSGLGRHEEAIEEIETAMRILPLELDALYAPQIIGNAAQIYADAGRQEEALDHLEQLLSIPFFITTTSLRLHPNWDSLRDHPRYKEILQKYQ